MGLQTTSIYCNSLHQLQMGLQTSKSCRSCFFLLPQLQVVFKIPTRLSLTLLFIYTWIHRICPHKNGTEKLSLRGIAIAALVVSALKTPRISFYIIWQQFHVLTTLGFFRSYFIISCIIS